MSQSKELLKLFEENGNKLTLGQILGNWTRVGSKYTNRISELRKLGYEVECVENKERPTDNLYILKQRPAVYQEPQGQQAWVFR